MFERPARLYDAIYAWKDYAAEAQTLLDVVRRLNPWTRTLLDVACGTGRHLAHLRAEFRVEGLDLDPELLAVAAERLPGVPLHEADMRSFDLGRTFDVVTILFSAIGYAVTPEGLRATVANLSRHTAPGGLVIIEPWILPEDYEHGRVHATFVDEPDLKLARINTSGPPGPVNVLEFHYLVGTGEGVETMTERHELGAFSHDDYVGAMRAAGLDAYHDRTGLMGRGLYVGVKPRP